MKNINSLTLSVLSFLCFGLVTANYSIEFGLGISDTDLDEIVIDTQSLVN
jgi:hypothetical protein